MQNTTCCFLGHRKIDVTNALILNLNNIIEKLITLNKVDTFLFGSKSQFDDLCYDIVTKLKQKYAHIKRIYVRAEFPYINDSYQSYILQSYEETYYPNKILKSGKAAYIERNYEMINNSNYCIVYFDKNYLPPKRIGAKEETSYIQPKSGTRLAYEYAVKNNKIIFNVFGSLL